MLLRETIGLQCRLGVVVTGWYACYLFHGGAACHSVGLRLYRPCGPGCTVVCCLFLLAAARPGPLGGYICAVASGVYDVDAVLHCGVHGSVFLVTSAERLAAGPDTPQCRWSQGVRVRPVTSYVQLF